MKGACGVHGGRNVDDGGICWDCEDEREKAKWDALQARLRSAEAVIEEQSAAIVALDLATRLNETAEDGNRSGKGQGGRRHLRRRAIQGGEVMGAMVLKWKCGKCGGIELTTWRVPWVSHRHGADHWALAVVNTEPKKRRRDAKEGRDG